MTVGKKIRAIRKSLKQTQKQLAKASGIGLYLCRRICHNLGHRITANSSLDSGTVIRIHLEQRTISVE